jgi:hypothetical protein
MEPSEKRSVASYMRALHRDIGFFLVGLVVIYSLSGMVLLYRDRGLLVSEVQVEKTLAPGLAPDELGMQLRIRGFRPLKTEGDVVQFREGTYNRATGVAIYKAKRFPAVLQKWVDLHKTTSASLTHWFALLFGALLCFLAVSSFWMCKPGTTTFRRGICLTTAGIVVTSVVLFL